MFTDTPATPLPPPPSPTHPSFHLFFLFHLISLSSLFKNSYYLFFLRGGGTSFPLKYASLSLRDHDFGQDLLPARSAVHIIYMYVHTCKLFITFLVKYILFNQRWLKDFINIRYNILSCYLSSEI